MRGPINDWPWKATAGSRGWVAQPVQRALRFGVKRIVRDRQLVPGARFAVTVQGRAGLAELAQ